MLPVICCLGSLAVLGVSKFMTSVETNIQYISADPRVNAKDVLRLVVRVQ